MTCEVSGLSAADVITQFAAWASERDGGDEWSDWKVRRIDPKRLLLQRAVHKFIVEELGADVVAVCELPSYDDAFWLQRDAGGHWWVVRRAWGEEGETRLPDEPLTRDAARRVLAACEAEPATPGA